MINKKMEALRKEINEMIVMENSDKNKLLAKSKEIDCLIIKSMRGEQGIMKTMFLNWR